MKNSMTGTELMVEYLKHPDDIKALQERASTMYEDGKYRIWEPDFFIEWTIQKDHIYYLIDPSNVKLIELLKDDSYIIDGKSYVPIIIDNSDKWGNIIYSRISIPWSWKRSYICLTESEAFAIKNLIIRDDVLVSLGPLKESEITKTLSELRFRTVDDWYGTFVDDDGKYVEGCLRERRDNIYTYTIMLSGNDDFSISKNYLLKEDAIRDWKMLSELDNVNTNSLPGSYFSN